MKLLDAMVSTQLKETPDRYAQWKAVSRFARTSPDEVDTEMRVRVEFPLNLASDSSFLSLQNSTLTLISVSGIRA